jgi:dolichol kinase
MVGLWALILISSLIHNLKKIKVNNESIKVNTNNSDPLKADFKRKINHIIFFILLWIGLALFNQFLQFPSEWNQQTYLSNVWEYNPNETFIIFLVLKDPSNIYRFGLYHSFYFVVFGIASYLMLILELIRHFRWLYFPTSKVIAKIIRKSEEEGIASSCLFISAITIVFIIMPPLLTVSIVIICLISDLIASQIGMRFGKNKISFNKKKSWEGSISATISGFLLSTIFIGPVYSIFAAIIFLITDILTEEKIRLSDNLLNPMLMMFMYILINLCGINYSFPRFLLPLAFR